MKTSILRTSAHSILLLAAYLVSSIFSDLLGQAPIAVDDQTTLWVSGDSCLTLSVLTNDQVSPSQVITGVDTTGLTGQLEIQAGGLSLRYCTDFDGDCRVCPPGTSRCVNSDIREVCYDDGAWINDYSCDDYCTGSNNHCSGTSSWDTGNYCYCGG